MASRKKYLIGRDPSGDVFRRTTELIDLDPERDLFTGLIPPEPGDEPEPPAVEEEPELEPDWVLFGRQHPTPSQTTLLRLLRVGFELHRPAIYAWDRQAGRHRWGLMQRTSRRLGRTRFSLVGWVDAQDGDRWVEWLPRP
jgi:hypothetical protein